MSYDAVRWLSLQPDVPNMGHTPSIPYVGGARFGPSTTERPATVIGVFSRWPVFGLLLAGARPHRGTSTSILATKDKYGDISPCSVDIDLTDRYLC